LCPGGVCLVSLVATVSTIDPNIISREAAWTPELKLFFKAS
jgi:hypothetical protein